MAVQDRCKAPAYQWYPKDYETDEAVRLMTYEQQGMYRTLLDHQWLEGSIPGNVDQIAVLLRVPAMKFRRLWPAMAMKFTDCGEGRLWNLRLERQRTDCDRFHQTQSANGKKGAQQRWRAHGTGNGEANSVVNGTAIESPMPENSSASASASSSAKKEIAGANERERMNTDPNLSHRARAFIERYPVIYARCRAGAQFRVREARDFEAFEEFVAREPSDERLDSLLQLFLKVQAKDFLNSPGTPRQFLHMLPECDRLLRENNR
jgi:uncharacterized protein YdaU (DUF1376 family)